MKKEYHTQLKNKKQKTVTSNSKPTLAFNDFRSECQFPKVSLAGGESIRTKSTWDVLGGLEDKVQSNKITNQKFWPWVNPWIINGIAWWLRW